MEDAAAAPSPAPEESGKGMFKLYTRFKRIALHVVGRYDNFFPAITNIVSTPPSPMLQCRCFLSAPEEQSSGGKYIAPHMRGGNPSGSKGDSIRPPREDQPTLRVTNLSEDATEGDVSDLFKRFGHISRVFLARDRETNVCKGFAFVSFTMREEAQRALEAVDGRGYDNLILRVEWAK